MVLIKLLTSFLLLATVQCSFYPDWLGTKEIDFQNTGTCLPPLYRGLTIKPFKRSYKHGEEIELSCKPGYEFQKEANVSTCRVFAVFGKHGVFMPAVTPKTCKRLPKCQAVIESGLKVEPFKMFYDIGEEITLSCMEGYELVKPEKQTCKRHRSRYGSGYVSFDMDRGPVCRKILDCDVLLHDGLILKPFKPSYKRGEEITMECEEGYELIAKKTSVCEISGLFDIEFIQNKFADISYYEHHLIMSTTPCRKKEPCSVPYYQGLIASPKQDIYLTGDEVTLSCEEDYDLMGSNTTTCSYVANGGYFGSFLESAPTGRFEPKISSETCRKKPRCIAPSKYKMSISKMKKYYMVRETIELSCDEGYELKGESKQTCEKDNRKWAAYSTGRFMPGMDNVICKKKPSCRAPKMQGVVLSPKKKVYGIGEKVSVSCEEGYVLKNVKESVCKEKKNKIKAQGSFKPEINRKVCEKIPSCSRPGKQDGVILSPDNAYYKIGVKVEISCEEGYELRVAPATTCTRTKSTAYDKDGRFDPYIPKEICRKHISCTAPEGEHYTVSPMKQQYEEGDKVTIICNEGYMLADHETLTCERSTNCKGQKGQVSGCFYPVSLKPMCTKKPSCKAPQNQEGLVIDPLQEKYFIDDEISLSCEDGYELTMANSSICELKTIDLQTALGTKQVEEMTFSPKVKEEACKKLPDENPKKDEGETKKEEKTKIKEVGTSKKDVKEKTKKDEEKTKKDEEETPPPKNEEKP